LGLVRAWRLPEPEQQSRITTPDGQHIIRADFCYPYSKVIVLTDGAAYHWANQSQWKNDLQQRNKLEAEGWKVLELSYKDVQNSRPYVANLLAVAFGNQPVASEDSIPSNVEYASNDMSDLEYYRSLSGQEARSIAQRFYARLDDGWQVGG